MADDTKTALLKSLIASAAASFNASRRIRNRDWRLTRLTAFSSAYVIILSILPYFAKLPPDATDLYNFFTVILSVIILTSSLLQYSGNHVLKADLAYRIGLEINELRRLFELEDASDPTALKEVLKNYSERYSAILGKYTVDHEDIDFHKFKLDSKPLTLRNVWFNFSTSLQIAFERVTPNFFLLVVSLLFAALIWHGTSSQIKQWIVDF